MDEIPRDSDWKRLKAENERLKAEVESKEQTLRYVDEWSRRMAPKIDRLVEEATAANAKIAELEQAATTLQQLEELLRDGWLITFEYGPFWITNRDYDTHDPYPTLPAAIAAAWERMVE